MKGGFIAFDWKSDNLVAQTGALADNVINVAMVAVTVACNRTPIELFLVGLTTWDSKLKRLIDDFRQSGACAVKRPAKGHW